jgi:hypothetical protein
MYRRGVVTFGAGVLVGVAIAGAPASQALTGPGVITITERQVQLGRVDEGRPGPSIGDVTVMRTLLYNKGKTPNPIGHGELVCTFTGDRTRNCSGTFFMPLGKIIVGGPLLFRQLFELAVLGGTGFYTNVRGTLTVTSLTLKPHVRDLLVFRLVP